jgi:hypothetical protein
VILETVDLTASGTDGASDTAPEPAPVQEDVTMLVDEALRFLSKAPEALGRSRDTQDPTRTRSLRTRKPVQRFSFADDKDYQGVLSRYNALDDDDDDDQDDDDDGGDEPSDGGDDQEAGDEGQEGEDEDEDYDDGDADSDASAGATPAPPAAEHAAEHAAEQATVAAPTSGL